MVDDVHYRALEEMYLGAPCNTYYDPEIQIEEGWAEVVVPVRSRQFHPGGSVHGTSYFKALDDSAYFAAHSLVRDKFLLTRDFDLQLQHTVSEGFLRGVGEVVDSGETRFVAESVVYDSLDREVARGKGGFVRSGMDLSQEIGYERG